MKKPGVAAAACAALGLAVVAQPASASVVKMSANGLLSIEPVQKAPAGQPPAVDPGENHDITIASVAGGVTVTDTTAPITVAGGACTLTSAPGALPAVATCADPAHPITHIRASGGKGNDSITNSTCIPALLDGGKGDDVLHGGCGADTLVGGGGHDKLYGGTGGGTIYTKGRGSNYATGKNTSQVFCVAGTDTTVYATKTDTVAAECKTVNRNYVAGKTPTPTGATPTTSPAVSPQLRLISARVLRGTLRMRGTLARNSTSALRLTVVAHIGRKTVLISRAAAVNRAAGTFSFAMKLGPRLAHARRLALVVRYVGDQRFLGQTVRRTISVPSASRRRR